MTAVPPAPSIGGAGGSRGLGDGPSLAAASPPIVSPPSPTESVGESDADQGGKPVVEELPMHIFGLAFAMPGTSFSSSYEVFIAKKEVSGHKAELIKLVYWFLPYQRRLSEYHPDASKMFKLRVTRDHACDESLIHMGAPPTGQLYAGSDSSADALKLSPESRSVVLPCYRTTADDYQKAAGRR